LSQGQVCGAETIHKTKRFANHDLSVWSEGDDEEDDADEVEKEKQKQQIVTPRAGGETDFDFINTSTDLPSPTSAATPKAQTPTRAEQKKLRQRIELSENIELLLASVAMSQLFVRRTLYTLSSVIPTTLQLENATPVLSAMFSIYDSWAIRSKRAVGNWVECGVASQLATMMIRSLATITTTGTNVKKNLQQNSKNSKTSSMNSVSLHPQKGPKIGFSILKWLSQMFSQISEKQKKKEVGENEAMVTDLARCSTLLAPLLNEVLLLAHATDFFFPTNNSNQQHHQQVSSSSNNNNNNNSSLRSELAAIALVIVPLLPSIANSLRHQQKQQQKSINNVAGSYDDDDDNDEDDTDSKRSIDAQLSMAWSSFYPFVVINNDDDDDDNGSTIINADELAVNLSKFLSEYIYTLQ
jgi:hypothetical protein